MLEDVPVNSFDVFDLVPKSEEALSTVLLLLRQAASLADDSIL